MIRPYKRAEVSFDLQQEIGHEGRNSRVHVAYDPNLDSQIVVKTITKATLDVDAYFSESRLLYKSVHPNVVPILYACEDTNSIYLAMPYYQRGSLHKAMTSSFLTAREVIRYTVHFLSGLHNVHSKGLVHLDVKPDNILLTDSNEALLSDFGLAKKTNYSGFAEQDRMYLKILPPEYFQTGALDVRSDVYQVGLTLYRMVNGDHAFYQQFDQYGDRNNFDRAQFKFDLVNERFPNRNYYLEHVPQRFRKIIAECLKSDPLERYKGVTEIVSALADISDPELDWRYHIESSGARVWSKSADNSAIQLCIEPSGQSYAQKTREGGSPRRITEYCCDGLKPSELRKFFKTDGA